MKYLFFTLLGVILVLFLVSLFIPKTKKEQVKTTIVIDTLIPEIKSEIKPVVVQKPVVKPIIIQKPVVKTRRDRLFHSIDSTAKAKRHGKVKR